MKSKRVDIVRSQIKQKHANRCARTILTACAVAARSVGKTPHSSYQNKKADVKKSAFSAFLLM
jgi:hypothetical protein